MSTAWDTYHHRATALRSVIADLDRSGSSTLPWDDELAAVFDDPDDLLVALHDLWTRRLAGRVDLALEIDEHESTESVALAWREVADELPGVRRVLDRNEDNPASALRTSRASPARRRRRRGHHRRPALAQRRCG